MQYADITVCISGDINFQVERTNCSIPEIALMREIHGADGVRNIRPTTMTKEPRSEAKPRLVARFQHSPKTLETIDKLWPGLSPQLPRTLAEIGLALDTQTMGTKERRGAERVKIATAPAAQDDDPDAENDDGSGYSDAPEPEGGEPVEEAAAPAAVPPGLMAEGAALARAARASKGA
jgi:hypothetical protein